MPTESGEPIILGLFFFVLGLVLVVALVYVYVRLKHNKVQSVDRPADKIEKVPCRHNQNTENKNTEN